MTRSHRRTAGSGRPTSTLRATRSSPHWAFAPSRGGERLESGRRALWVASDCLARVAL